MQVDEEDRLTSAVGITSVLSVFWDSGVGLEQEDLQRCVCLTRDRNHTTLG